MEPSAAFDALYRLRGDPLLRVLDGLRLADQRCALGDLFDVPVLRPGDDQIVPDPEDGQRLGARVGLPRHSPARYRGHDQRCQRLQT